MKAKPTDWYAKLVQLHLKDSFSHSDCSTREIKKLLLE